MIFNVSNKRGSVDYKKKGAVDYVTAPRGETVVDPSLCPPWPKLSASAESLQMPNPSTAHFLSTAFTVSLSAHPDTQLIRPKRPSPSFLCPRSWNHPHSLTCFHADFSPHTHTHTPETCNHNKRMTSLWKAGILLCISPISIPKFKDRLETICSWTAVQPIAEVIWKISEGSER